MVLLSVNFFAAVAYTRPRLGQLSGCCCGTVLVKVQWVGVATPARLTHAISLAWLHTNHPDPFQLWYPVGIFFAVPTSWKQRIWNGLKMPMVQSRWGVNWTVHLVEAGGEAAWCHCCLLYPKLLCSCWLFSSTEQHDFDIQINSNIIHFDIQIEVEHFKAMFTLFVCLFFEKRYLSQIILCMLCVCMWVN